MSMPKGFKSTHGYATVSEIENGLDYRAIAKVMCDEGFQMNHATARNIFLRAMQKIAVSICQIYKLPLNNENISRIAKDPRFQSAIVDLLADM